MAGSFFIKLETHQGAICQVICKTESCSSAKILATNENHSNKGKSYAEENCNALRIPK